MNLQWFRNSMMQTLLQFCNWFCEGIHGEEVFSLIIFVGFWRWCLFLRWGMIPQCACEAMILLPPSSGWRWRQQGPLKCWYRTTSHTLTTQKTETWNLHYHETKITDTGHKIILEMPLHDIKVRVWYNITINENDLTFLFFRDNKFKKRL
jgi:hypothetical protein